MWSWAVRGVLAALAAFLVIATVPRSTLSPAQVPTPTSSATEAPVIAKAADTCRGLDDSGASPIPFPARTAAEVIEGTRRDPSVRLLFNDLAGVRPGPMRDPRAPQCRPDLLELGQSVFVRQYPATTGRWLLPVRYQDQTLVTVFVYTDLNGMGTVGGDRRIRKLTDRLRAERSRAGVVGDELDPQRRCVGDRGELVVAEVRGHHAAVLDVQLLHDRLAQAEDEATLELPAQGDRIDHRADVGDERGVVDLQRTRFAVDRQAQHVRVHGGLVRLLRRFAGHFHLAGIVDRAPELGELRFEHPSRVQRSAPLHRCHSTTADPWIAEHGVGCAAAHGNATRRNPELGGDDPLEERVRAA